MKDDYAPRPCVSLPFGARLEYPSEMPELVHLHDLAMLVFPDN